MATNIEINILNSNNIYDVLYPKVNLNNNDSTDLSIENGGTGASNVSSAVYNLLYPLGSRSASSINSYASTTYLGCYYGSIGYKVPVSNLMTYINNNISVPGYGIEVIHWLGTTQTTSGSSTSDSRKIITFPTHSGKTGKYCLISGMIYQNIVNNKLERSLIVPTFLINDSSLTYAVEFKEATSVYSNTSDTTLSNVSIRYSWPGSVDNTFSNNGFTVKLRYINEKDIQYTAVLFYA